MIAYKVMFSRWHRISGEPCHSDQTSQPHWFPMPEHKWRAALCQTGPLAECGRADEPCSRLEGSGLGQRWLAGSHPWVASESPGRPTEAQISRFGPRVSDSAGHGLLNTVHSQQLPGWPWCGVGATTEDFCSKVPLMRSSCSLGWFIFLLVAWWLS